MQGLPESVAGIEIEDRLNLGSGFVGKINEGAAARHWHQHRDGSFLDCQLNKVERIVDNLNRTAEVQPADNREAPLQRPVEDG